MAIGWKRQIERHLNLSVQSWRKKYAPFVYILIAEAKEINHRRAGMMNIVR